MDPKTLSAVSKLANRATSDNPSEAEAAARGAVGRLKKAGATFEEFLTELDPAEVFQNGLVRVADRYVSSREDLSEPAKRELFAALIAGINYRYGKARSEDPVREGKVPSEDPVRPERPAAEPSPSPAKPRPAPACLRVWKEDPAFAARAAGASLLFGAFAAVAGPLLAAFAFAAAGGLPPWAAGFSAFPVAKSMAFFGILGFAVRNAAFFEPEWGEKLFSRFP